MTRALTSAAQAALAADQVRAANLVHVALDGDPIRFASTPHSIDWGGQNWLGLGLLGSVAAIDEGADLEMFGIEITISGIPQELVAAALAEDYQGKLCEVYLALFDTASGAIIDDPVLVFQGRTDSMTIELGETASIIITAESRMTDWNRPRIVRYTNEEQQALYPGDRGLEFVSSATSKEIIWGRA